MEGLRVGWEVGGGGTGKVSNTIRVYTKHSPGQQTIIHRVRHIAASCGTQNSAPPCCQLTHSR